MRIPLPLTLVRLETLKVTPPFLIPYQLGWVPPFPTGPTMAPPRPRHTRPRSSHTTTLLRHRSGVCARHPTSSLSSSLIRPPLFLLFGEPRRDSCIRLVANRCWRSHASSSGSTHSSVPASATESDRKTSQHLPDIAVVGLGPCGARPGSCALQGREAASVPGGRVHRKVEVAGVLQ